MASDAAAAQPSALVDFVAGTAAGIASLLAGHPFDTVKTRLQTQPHSLPHTTAAVVAAASAPTPSPSSASAVASTSKPALHPESRPLLSSSSTNAAPSARSSHHAAIISTPLRRPDGTVPIYRSATHAFRVIVKEERLLGLYKGVTSPMLGVAVMNASIFGFYGLALRFQQQHDLFASSRPHSGGVVGDAASSPTLTQIMVAGMVSGLGSSLITAPIDLIKIREQMDLSSRSGSASSTRPSTYRVLVNIVKTEGVFRGLFRGWGCTAIRDLGYGPYFWSYELMNRYLASRGTDGSMSDGRLRPLSNVELAVSGGIAGVLAWLSTFWADVIKTKVQATTRFDDVVLLRPPARANGGTPTAPAPATQAPWWSRSLFLRTAAETYADGGVRAFFAGVGPTVLRALPVNAVMFIVFESVKDALVARGL